MSHYRVTLAALALGLAVAAGAAGQDTGFGAGTPESRYFRVESQVAAGRRGPVLEGYVYNLYDVHATTVQLRAELLDGAGRLLETRVVYVTLDVPPRGRSFFQTKVPAEATGARVSVLSYQWAPRGGG